MTSTKLKRLAHLGVVDSNLGFFGHEVANEGDRGRLASIASVSLEGKAQNSNTLQETEMLKMGIG